MRAVVSPVHRRHDPAAELEFGLLVEPFEHPGRADMIEAALVADPAIELVGPTEHGAGPIEAVHDPGLVEFLGRAWADFQGWQARREVVPDTFLHPGLREGMGPAPAPHAVAAELGRWCFETQTPIVEGSYAAARAAVDVALTAADLVLAGERAAYGLCRPPGHHAARSVFGGYCFFNNAAVVAEAARAHVARVAVLDVDYHHGNGTQQIFYDRGDVAYVSLHGDPRRAYPYFAGFEEEGGTGAGRGANLNLPLPVRLDDEGYLATLDHALDVVERFDPGLLVVSLGVDTYERDPISDLAVTTEGMEACGRLVGALGRPTVVLQEGGYALDALGENVRRWLLGVAG